MGAGARTWLRDPRLILGGAVLMVLMVAGLFPDSLSPHDPDEMRIAQRLQGPSRQFPAGTDEYGRDLLSRVIHGARTTLTVAAGSVGLAVVIGLPLGALAAYYRGAVESVIMRAMEFILSFPPYVLGIGLVAFLGASLGNVIVAIGILYVPRIARVVYGAVLTVREKDFIVAARALGAGDLRILAVHVVPNILGPLIVQVTLAMGHSIHLEAGLSFLGLGPPPPEPVWGRMVYEGRQYWLRNPAMFIAPSVGIASTIIAFNLLGDALRDHFDPRVRSGR